MQWFGVTRVNLIEFVLSDDSVVLVWGSRGSRCLCLGCLVLR
jgi:hypothetical protein